MPDFDVCVVGEINLDLILYGLPKELVLDRELLASGLAVTLGSSSAIFAHNLAMLGSKVGFVGLERDEATAIARSYYQKLPAQLASAETIILDPMLATGGSAIATVELLKQQRARSIRLACVVAAPEGIAALTQRHPDVRIFTATIDRELNDRKYILPGLGDFGDRYFGTT